MNVITSEESIAQRVYESIMGETAPRIRLDWVEPMFLPGMPLYQAYADMRGAYDHLLERLNEVDEDRDVEQIIDSLLDYGQILAMEMFEYGRKYQKMLEKDA